MKAMFLLLVSFVLILAFMGCVSYEQISDAIENENYCSVDADCKVAYLQCCGSYVNKNADIGYLNMLVAEYNFWNAPEHCSCATPIMPVCEQGKCIAKTCELNKDYEKRVALNDLNVAMVPCSCPPESKYEHFGGKFQCVETEEIQKQCGNLNDCINNAFENCTKAYFYKDIPLKSGERVELSIVGTEGNQWCKVAYSITRDWGSEIVSEEYCIIQKGWEYSYEDLVEGNECRGLPQ